MVLFKCPERERYNVLTHGIGFLVALAAFVSYCMATYRDDTTALGCMIFGAAQVIIYVTSVCYHAATGLMKRRFHVLDHVAIYVLIATTHTATMLSLPSVEIQPRMIGVIWAVAGLGSVLKLRFTGQFEAVSVTLYLLIGWVGAFVIGLANLLEPTFDVQLMMAGGACYTIGVIFYIIDRGRWCHAFWHVFVVVASSLHSIALYIGGTSV